MAADCPAASDRKTLGKCASFVGLVSVDSDWPSGTEMPAHQEETVSLSAASIITLVGTASAHLKHLQFLVQSLIIQLTAVHRLLTRPAIGRPRYCLQPLR